MRLDLHGHLPHAAWRVFTRASDAYYDRKKTIVVTPPQDRDKLYEFPHGVDNIPTLTAWYCEPIILVTKLL